MIFFSKILFSLQSCTSIKSILWFGTRFGNPRVGKKLRRFWQKWVEMKHNMILICFLWVHRYWIVSKKIHQIFFKFFKIPVFTVSSPHRGPFGGRSDFKARFMFFFMFNPVKL